MPEKVGVILINYKDYARQYLSACGAALRRQDYPTEATFFYIVDNASTPESVAYLRDIFPEALVLPRADGNYAAANNLGCRQAIADGCQFLVSVNMDTEMTASWLSEIVRGLKSDPAVGLVQSKILLYPQGGIQSEATHSKKSDGTGQGDKINSLGNIINFLGFGYTSCHGQPDRDISGYPEIKGYASGCSLAMKRDVFLKIGGYNEEYYMYHDDLEISLKARLAGYKIVLAPRSVIYHKYQFSRSVKMVYYMERNRYLTVAIFYPLPLLLLAALPGLAMDIGLLFFSLVKGWFREELKIYRYFFRLANYVKIIQERRKMRAWQVVPFRAVARDFSGRIEFQEISNPILKYLVNPVFNLYWQIAKKFI